MGEFTWRSWHDGGDGVGTRRRVMGVNNKRGTQVFRGSRGHVEIASVYVGFSRVRKHNCHIILIFLEFFFE